MQFISRKCEGTGKELGRILHLVEEDSSVFPFNEYELLICNLIEIGGLTFDRYMEIRSDYISQNPNLWMFEVSSPTTFGVKIAQTLVQAKCIKMKQATKALDPEFNSEYDLWLDNIKIEVKASRAVDKNSDEPLYSKALSRNTDKEFLMNFQQLKPQCCDVFIWVAVFRDEIVLWVMNSDEVLNNHLYSEGQHRGNWGNEGQIHVKDDNIHTFDPFELKENELEQAVKDAVRRNQ